MLVFAAASLKNALDAVAAGWAEESGDTATISYAASSALARQIEEGAPADVFFSADLAWMDYLEERDLIDPATRTSLLGNRIVLVGGPDAAPIDDRTGLRSRRCPRGRQARDGERQFGAGRQVRPSAALESLGIWESVAGEVAQADNVRAALSLVSLGEAPLGIVYATDANADDNVTVVGTFPADTHPPIVYPVARTASSASDATASFLDYLATPAARADFEAQGFTVLD